MIKENEIKYFYYKGKEYNIYFPSSGIRDDGIYFLELNETVYYKLGGIDYYKPAYLGVENVLLYFVLCIEEG